MNKNFWLIPIGILALWLSGCAPREAPFPVPLAPAPVEQVKPEAREGWQAEWQKTVEAARKEGRVLVYGATTTMGLKEAVPLFRKKFGIELEMIIGRGPDLVTKLLQEKAAGLHVADVVMTGPNSILGTVKPAGVIAPLEPALILPEVLDSKAWFGGELPWMDKDRHVIAFLAYPSRALAINTKLVRLDDIKSYFDLLNLRWKDKIVISDPTIAGPAFNGFASLLVNKVVGLNFFRQLVSMQSTLTRDDRLQVEWLARGRYPISFWPRPAIVAEFIEAGAPVAESEVKEGTFLSTGGSGTVLIDRAPHPNAARVLINWLLTREGQMIIQDFGGLSSAREDISIAKLDSLNVRKKSSTYFPSANAKEEWILYEQDNYQRMAKEVFAPLLK